MSVGQNVVANHGEKREDFTGGRGIFNRPGISSLEAKQEMAGYATNELSFMCLDATANLDYHEPALTVRTWNETPDEFWKKTIEVTKLGMGMPAIFNDEVIIPQLINRGMSLEDARNYAIVGCVEPASPGNSYPRCGGPGSGSFINLPQCLLLAINNGVNPLTNEQVGPATGDLSSFRSFDEVKDAYVKQIEYFTGWYVTLTNMWETIIRQFVPMRAGVLCHGAMRRAGY